VSTSPRALTRHARPVAVFRALVLACFLVPPALVSAQSTQGNEPATVLPNADDKTGTNPLNIQTTVVVLNEFRSLPDELFNNQSRYRYVIPVARRRMSARVDIPIVASNVTGRTEAAFGDLDFGWSWIPWIERSHGVLAGVDTTWNTSTNDALGRGRHTVAPFVQMVFLPSPTTTISAGYEQRQSVGGDRNRLDVSEGMATLRLTWLPVPAMWIIAEPRILMDYERDNTSGQIDVEWGRLLFGGVGTYIRPGVGLGSPRARSFDWALQVGFRVIP